MKKNIDRLGFVLLAIVPALVSQSFLAGCVTKTRIVREEKLTFPLQSETPAEQERDGLTVTIKAFGPENVNQDPANSKVVSYTLSDQKGQAITRTVPITLLPKPYFKVTIRNHTEFALRLDRAIIRIKDEAGNDLKLMTKRELQEWAKEGFAVAVADAATRGHSLVFDTTPVDAAYRGMRLLTRDTEIGPEDTFTGYLAFGDDLLAANASDAALNKWADQAGILKLQMYQIPCAVDQAGNVTKATKFEFILKPKVEVQERTEEYKALF